jgi:hypothetical protein
MLKKSIFGMTTFLVVVVLMFDLAGCDTGNGPSGDGDDTMGSVTVNNLPALPEAGFTVNVLPNPGYTISSQNNFQPVMTDSNSHRKR